MLAPPDLDPLAVRRQFGRRARQLARADFLWREIESRMLERLALVRLEPQSVVDIGCGAGAGLLALARRYPQARLIGVDASLPVAQCAHAALQPPERGFLARMFGPEVEPIARVVAADARALPLADASVDLVWSNLALHWFEDPDQAIAEWYRIMRPAGLLDFSFFGVDTLTELRALGAHTMTFHDMHDVGDALMAAGFSEPVMDMQRITLTWQSAERLLEDVRALGGNALRERRQALSGRGEHREWLQAIESLRGEDGLIRGTIEVAFGHAWCPRRKRRADGLASVEFQPRRMRSEKG